MDQKILVTPDFSIGDEVLESLDAAKFPVAAAAWVLSDELGGWQVVGGTTLYEELGTRGAYGRLIDAVRSKDPDSLIFNDVRLMSSNHPFIREVRRIFEHRGFRKGVSMGGNIGGMWVDDAKFYRA